MGAATFYRIHLQQDGIDNRPGPVVPVVPVVPIVRLFSLALIMSAAWTQGALACSSCACGDPTLTTMGTEKPFLGRLRISTLVQHRGERAGTAGLDELRTQEQRVELSAAVQVLEPLQLSLRLPLVRREVQHVNLARDRVFHLGDLELRAKYFVYQDREFSPRHLLALQAGLRMPTAPEAQDPDGNRLVLEAQTGSGSFDPMLGLSYGYFLSPFSIFVSLTALLPTPSRFDARAGYAALGTVSAQYQPFGWLGLQAGLDARFDTPIFDRGQKDPHSGGFIAFASPGLVLKPIEDLLISATVRIPFYQALSGEHKETVMMQAGVVYDL